MSNNPEEIERLLTDDSFIRWIEGDASEPEKLKWEEWLQNDYRRKELVEEVRILHQAIRFKATERPELESELNRLRGSISATGLREISNHIGAWIGQLNRQFVPRFAAAMLLLIVGVAIIFIIPESDVNTTSVKEIATEYKRISTQSAERKILKLSDGSRIILNSNTSLKYPINPVPSEWDVWVEGEAYFDIQYKSGAERRTFTVNTTDGEISVLGTKFNVNTYSQGTEVYLDEGQVSIEVMGSSATKRDSYIMEPGEFSSFSRDGNEIVSIKANSEIYTGWKDNKLVFDRATLSEVAERIGQIYDVEFQVDQSELNEIIVSGSIPNNNLDVFLNVLEKLVGRKVVNSEGTIYLDEKIQTKDKIH